MIGSYLLIFTPVFAAGVFTGWFVPWVVREWRRGLAVIADAQHGGNDVPVPYWPTGKADGAEWDRVDAALKEDW